VNAIAKIRNGEKWLSLRSDYIHENGVVSIAAALKGSKLIRLDICSNLIGDSGAEALAKGLKRSRLIELNLEYNLVSDSGLYHLLKC
jgi:Ran GTPase-activating protein (RanGAP) involved in mRNA processing and transport